MKGVCRTFPRYRRTVRSCTSTRPGELARHAGGGGGLYRYDTLTGTTTYVAPAQGYPALHEPQQAWYEKRLGIHGA